MADFDNILDTLKDEVRNLVSTHLDDFQDAATEDLDRFLENSEEDLRRWTELLAEGDISEKDFRSLVEGKKDLAKMEALKQTGLAAAEIDRLRDDFLDRVVGVTRRVLG